MANLVEITIRIGSWKKNTTLFEPKHKTLYMRLVLLWNKECGTVYQGMQK
jgi:hypothetical protein